MDNNSSANLKPRNLISNNNNYALNGKIMLCSVIILFIAIVTMICFHIYARWFFKRRHRGRRQESQNRFSLSNATIASDGVAPQGLDLSIVKALPTFVYNSKTDDPVECSVCLSEFHDNEEGRLLPKCKHAFHLSCIDMWFESHSSCPLCRGPVQNNINERAAETVVSVIEPAGSVPELCFKEVIEMGCSSSLSTSSLPRLECQRKPLKLVGTALVEGPTGDQNQKFRALVDPSMGSTGRHESTSPVNNVLS